jgi:WD40 repeat protein
MNESVSKFQNALLRARREDDENFIQKPLIRVSLCCVIFVFSLPRQYKYNIQYNETNKMPLTRRQQAAAEKSTTAEGDDSNHSKDASNEKKDQHNVMMSDDDDDDDDEPEQALPQLQQSYILDGQEYKTYQDMVNAKRKRNENVLKDLGFLDPQKQRAANSIKKEASSRGIKKQKTNSTEATAPVTSSRKSSRLAGVQTSFVALDYHVNWNSSNAVVAVEGSVEDVISSKEDMGGASSYSGKSFEPEFYKGRVNDGSDLSIQQAVELNEPKWIKDNSVELALDFQKELLQLKSAAASAAATTAISTNVSKTTTTSPTSVVAEYPDVDDMQSKLDNLYIDNEEWVAKVTPDRIYNVCCHPSEHKLIVAAGDKQGHIGIWDVDAPPGASNNGVHLFRIHSRPICCLEWASPSTMISASYDGSVRSWNVETGTFEELFATYDDSDSYYAEDLGFGLDEGYRYWTQYVALDHRNSGGSSNPCLFVSTSVGTAMHLDLRAPDKQRITFHEKLSEKKINTLR